MTGLIVKAIKYFLPRGKFLIMKRKLQELKKKRFLAINEVAFKKILVSKFNLKSGDIVFVHSAVGDLNINFPATRILDLLLETIGDKGTLLFPCWQFLNRAEDHFKGEHKDFDVRKTRSKLGFLTEWARMNKSSKRSLHPCNSIVAIGRDTDHFLSEHHQDIYPCGIKSPFYKLIEKKAKIIGLGVDVNNLTFVHCAEDIEPDLFSIKTRSDKIHEISVINQEGLKEIVKTVLADKEIGKRDPIKFFDKYISNDKCLRFRSSGSSFFMAQANILHKELIIQAKKGNTIYSVTN